MLTDLPLGYLVTLVTVGAAVASATWPRPTPGSRATPTFVLGTIASEAPFVLGWYLIAATVLALVSGDLATPAGRVILVVAAAVLAGLGRIVWQSAAAPRVLDAALTSALGQERFRDRSGERLARSAWALVAPLRVPDPRVRRDRDIAYGPEGRAHLLDVYRRRGVAAGPAFVYFHPGGFHSGSKNRQAKLLLETLAVHGWVCVSANYHLRTDYRVALTDAKRVLAWVRDDGRAHGIDPRTVVVAGGSAGAHLAATCALSAGRRDLQPGFEDADTSVTGAVGLYGYYGPAAGTPPRAPEDFADAPPPLLVVHGEKDPMASCPAARAFAASMSARGGGPVGFAELPGAVHNFDLFACLRHGAVTSAVLEFVTWIRQQHPGRPTPPRPAPLA